jgi:hypothetical protein
LSQIRRMAPASGRRGPAGAGHPGHSAPSRGGKHEAELKPPRVWIEPVITDSPPEKANQDGNCRDDRRRQDCQLEVSTAAVMSTAKGINRKSKQSERGKSIPLPLRQDGVSMKSKRTGILRTAVVMAASLTMVCTVSTAAQAHAVSISAGPGSAGLAADHLTVWVCKNAGTVPVWATLRLRDGSLKRYDGPVDPGFCRNHNVGGEPTAIRLCWGSGQNTCTAFKEA